MNGTVGNDDDMTGVHAQRTRAHEPAHRRLMDSGLSSVPLL